MTENKETPKVDSSEPLPVVEDVDPASECPEGKKEEAEVPKKPNDMSWLDDKVLRVITENRQLPTGTSLILDFGDRLFVLNRALGGNKRIIDKRTGQDMHHPLLSTYTWDYASLPEDMWVYDTFFTNCDPTIRFGDPTDFMDEPSKKVPQTGKEKLAAKMEAIREKESRKAGKKRLASKKTKNNANVVIDPQTGIPKYSLTIMVDVFTAGLIKNCKIVPYVEEQYICTVPSKRRIMGFFILPYDQFAADKNIQIKEWMAVRNAIQKYNTYVLEAISTIHVTKLKVDIHREEKEGKRQPRGPGDMFVPAIEFHADAPDVSVEIIEDSLFGKEEAIIAAEIEETYQKNLYKPTHEEAGDHVLAAAGFMNLQLIALEKAMTPRQWQKFVSFIPKFQVPNRIVSSLSGLLTDSSLINDPQVVELASEYGTQLRNLLFQKDMVVMGTDEEGKPTVREMTVEEKAEEIGTRKMKLKEALQNYKDYIASIPMSLEDKGVFEIARLIFNPTDDSLIQMVSNQIKEDQSKIPAMVQSSLLPCIEILDNIKRLTSAASETEKKSS